MCVCVRECVRACVHACVCSRYSIPSGYAEKVELLASPGSAERKNGKSTSGLLVRSETCFVSISLAFTHGDTSSCTSCILVFFFQFNLIFSFNITLPITTRCCLYCEGG